MKDNVVKILSGVFGALVAVFGLLMNDVKTQITNLQSSLQSKVDKELKNSEHAHLRDLIKSEKSARESGDGANSHRIGRIEEVDDIEKMK